MIDLSFSRSTAKQVNQHEEVYHVLFSNRFNNRSNVTFHSAGFRSDG